MSLRLLHRPRARHRGIRRRSLRVVLALLVLGSGTAVVASVPTAEAVVPTVVVPATNCRQFDPNVVSGACLKYQSKSGIAFTWIGTYRASNGLPFFCIDYLYDSRISATASRISTANLRNQLDRPVGAAEVAALNYLISTRAPQGTAGSAVGNAAIALIIRELMGDGIRNDGTVVYPPGLRVHGAVRSVIGGTPDGILSTAQSWWNEASQHRGPWSIRLTAVAASPTLPLGQSADYQLRVISADARTLVGVVVTLSCTGPISCPAKVRTGTKPVTVTVKPTALGSYTLKASVTGPSAQGQLLKGPWASHTGTRALSYGVQRGWIAQRVASSATAQGAAEIVKATPAVVTQAQPAAQAGDSLTDLVTVSGLPEGYDHPMTATLYGPFASAPTADSCTADKVKETVSIPLTENGTRATPPVTAASPGFYVWTESLVGDDLTLATTTPCGVAAETTVVSAPPAKILDTPRFRTSASAQRIAVPGRVWDTVDVSGLSSGAVGISWELLGPLAPRADGCAGLDWTKAPVLASGHVTAGNGTVRTSPVPVGVAGCYTYREHSAATPSAVAGESRAGLPEETVLALRPRPRVVPEVPTGPDPQRRGWWAAVLDLWVG